MPKLNGPQLISIVTIISGAIIALVQVFTGAPL